MIFLQSTQLKWKTKKEPRIMLPAVKSCRILSSVLHQRRFSRRKRYACSEHRTHRDATHNSSTANSSKSSGTRTSAKRSIPRIGVLISGPVPAKYEGRWQIGYTAGQEGRDLLVTAHRGRCTLRASGVSPSGSTVSCFLMYTSTCAGMQHPLIFTGMQHPLTCTGIQLPLTCAGI